MGTPRKASAKRLVRAAKPVADSLSGPKPPNLNMIFRRKTCCAAFYGASSWRR